MDRILIIEDTDVNIELLKGALSNKYKLSIAKNGKIALDIMEKVLPDLILLDIMMPVMDGYETIKRIKMNIAYKDIPIIFLTAQTQLDEKTKGFDLGAVDYITKPFFSREVVSRIEAHLSVYHAKKEARKLLSGTVVGATKVLMEMLATLNPTAYKFANRIKGLTRGIIEHLDLEEGWKIEVAAMLSMIGTYTLSDDVLSKIFKNEWVDPKYMNVYERRFEIGASLIEKIPRYSEMAVMIRRQDEQLGMFPYNYKDIELSGAQIIKIANYFEINRIRSVDRNDIIVEMRRDRRLYAVRVVKALEMFSVTEVKKHYKNINWKELKVGMTISKPIINKEGKTVVEDGVVVDEQLLKLLNLTFKYEMDTDYVSIK